MSLTCSLSETSSGCSCACYPLRLPGPSNTLPFAPQPFVYYATVPEVDYQRQNGREKSNKPNCFVKAFRWYTHEHGANKSTGVQRIADETKDIGFATWLDSKYEQYLRDSQLKNDHWKSEASNMHNPTPYQDTATHKSAKPRGFQRVLRSPWRKRQAAVKSPDREQACKDCKSSCQILLRPKSLSHLESETCPKKRSTSCGATSRVTVTSSETQITVRTYSKRQELFIQDIFDSDIETRNNKDSNIINGSHSENTYTLKNDYSSVGVKKSKTKLICECPVDSNEKVSKTTNVGTQYVLNENIDVKPPDNAATDRMNSKTDHSNKSSESVRPGSIKNAQISTAKEKHIKIDMGTEYKPESYCVCKARALDPCHHIHKNIRNNNKQKYGKDQRTNGCHKLSAEGSIQTSDNAITPINATSRLPLLLRIVSQRQY